MIFHKPTPHRGQFSDFELTRYYSMIFISRIIFMIMKLSHQTICTSKNNHR
jgi:hypothetical protein